jgi:hypothetical protein
MAAGAPVVMATLYPSVLGDRFDALPSVLRRFHARTDARAHGLLRVERGRGLVARLAGWVMRFPPASERVEVRLHVGVEQGREVWTRWFAGRPMITRQWRDGTCLVEAAGPSRTWFELESEPEGMRFVQRRCTILGVPIPSKLAPHVHCRVCSGDDEGWEVEVRITLPVVGLLVAYAGRLIPD